MDTLKSAESFVKKERSLETARRYRRMDLSEGADPVFENMPDLTPSSFKNSYIGITDF